MSDWNVFDYLEKDAFPGDEMDFSSFKAALEKHGFQGFFLNEKLIGYVYLNAFGEIGHMHRIAIVKNMKRKGYGSKLMEYAIDYFKKRNCKKMSLYVDASNKEAISFYFKHGMKKSHDGWHYVINYQDLNIKYLKNLETSKFELKNISESLIPVIVEKWDWLNEEQIRSQLTAESNREIKRNLFLGLFEDTHLVGYARFNPEYSGCMPFCIESLRHADIFLKKLENYMLEGREEIRITFEFQQNLADQLATRNYTLHHHLNKLYLDLI